MTIITSCSCGAMFTSDETRKKHILANCNTPSDDLSSIKEDLIAGAGYGYNDTECCLHAGIQQPWLKVFIAGDVEFAVAFAKAKGKPTMSAKKRIAESIENSLDTNDAKWWLSRRAKEEFSERLEQTGANGTPLIVQTITYAQDNEDRP